MELVDIKSIRFENLTFFHEGQDILFQNVDFQFPTDSILWIRADSGTGRSTLLQLLACLQLPNAGSYYLNDLDVTDTSFEDFLPYRLNIGYAFDYGGLLNNRSLLENLTLPLLYHKILTPREAIERAHEYLDIFEVLKYKNERPAHVAGSVRKITVLLRSLMLHPQMLLLDDASVGLSQQNMHRFVDLIHRLRGAGHLKHLFISSFDHNFVNLFDYQTVGVENLQLFLQASESKKALIL